MPFNSGSVQLKRIRKSDKNRSKMQIFYGIGNPKEINNSNKFERSTVLSRIRIDCLFLETMDLGTRSQPPNNLWGFKRFKTYKMVLN